MDSKSKTMSVGPFNRLVKLVARAFYDDLTSKGENQPKTGKSDNRGIAVVVLDALTRRQWVREEDLAKDLKLHSKQLRRTLRFLEEEKLVSRDHRKETAKGAKMYSAAVAATVPFGKEGEEKIKLHTHSYCCLDYAQVYDIVRYRLHRMNKKLKDELDNKNPVQKYICPNCGKRYTAFEALQLISAGGDYFECGSEICKAELVAESDKLAAEEGGDGDDNARKRRHEKVDNMFHKMEGQLKPLVEQVERIKGLDPPELLTLQAWEAQASAAGRANGDSCSNDPSRSSQGFGGTPMPFLGDPKFEVDLPGSEGNKGGVKSEEASTSHKVLPPWLIMQKMNNLTKEQRGEADQESKTSGSSTAAGFSDDKKSTVEDDKKTLQDEYAKAYYAAYLEKQQELEAASKQNESSNTSVSDGLSGMSSSRQVGSKSKRDEEDEGDDNDDWADASAPTAGNTNENYKVDLNVEAEASGEDDDDDMWEEG